MTETCERTYTAEEFVRLRDWKHYELVSGELVPYPCGAEASEACTALISELQRWSGRRRAWIFSSGAPYCFTVNPRTVRRPWVSLIREERLRHEDIPSVEPLTLAPDLVAEIITPLHTYEDVEGKVKEYRSAGVRLVWVISPKSRTVLIRRLDGTCAEVGESGTLSGEDVIPGFTCAVAELFV
ncbi:Uncharacterized protein OS=Candidatus Entotheonella sp. TSY1 GN=ETSY1_25475 PE=4 SV=1: Uma2 [Gemmataceae bacterium]|nr:Uncharacterized protein OS=Candidatus Entotheonella sp. TSY1 GN=ETSY1_25475 PE=4 SV=1: Uma2 [Gemmataceae bacterium]VTU02218.1 Uncharacterized protein OS=Candidatus Entotheonella sp. TSY1 GN=ETSY1_25475 PE=4 SV=1: Uma2 [Gemmataceae bacterium]